MNQDKLREEFHQWVMSRNPIESADIADYWLTKMQEREEEIMSKLRFELEGKIEIEERMKDHMISDEKGIGALYPDGRINAFQEVIALIRNQK